MTRRCQRTELWVHGDELVQRDAVLLSGLAFGDVVCTSEQEVQFGT